MTAARVLTARTAALLTTAGLALCWLGHRLQHPEGGQ